MYDEIDQYVGRSLKNWAARQVPSKVSWQRLLYAAVKPVEKRRSIFARFLLEILTSRDPFERIIYPQCEWEFEPAFSSMIGPIHFAARLHLIQ